MRSINILPPAKYLNKSRYDWNKCVISNKTNFHLCYSKGSPQAKRWNKAKSLNKMHTFQISDISESPCLLNANTKANNADYSTKYRNFSMSKYKSTTLNKKLPAKHLPRQIRAHSNCSYIHHPSYLDFYKGILNDYASNKIRIIMLHSLKPVLAHKSGHFNKTSVDECISTMNEGSSENCYW